jgi:hypothetical protein
MLLLLLLYKVVECEIRIQNTSLKTLVVLIKAWIENTPMFIISLEYYLLFPLS